MQHRRERTPLYEPLPLSEQALAGVERVARKLCGGHDARALIAATAALSRVYTRERGQMQALESDRAALLGKLGFFWARDLTKVFGPLDELTRCGLMPQRERLRVLDVGAGLGATSFGVARWVRLAGAPVRALDVVALEQSQLALQAFAALTRELAGRAEELAPIALEARAGDLRKARRGGPYDLILFGFVLNELDLALPLDERVARRAALLCDAARQLADGGAIVVLEPALKQSARELMQLRDVLAARGEAPWVIAPCLHAHACPMLPSERDWCHQELPYALPAPLATVARAAGLRYEGLSYASLVLANQPRPPAAHPLHRVVSDPLTSKGKRELFTCSGHGYVRLTRLNRDASPTNEPFDEARRGDILTLEPDAQRIERASNVTRMRSPRDR